MEFGSKSVLIAARAIAEAADAGYCFDEMDDWDSFDKWERDAYPDKYSSMAEEDCRNFIKQARAALEAVRESREGK